MASLRFCFGIFVFVAFFGELSLAFDNGLGLLPPMGWNTWCTLGPCGRDYCNEDEVIAIAEAMVSNGMTEIGFQYVNLDDCWASYRDASGSINPDPTRFPNGMAYVADYLHDMNLRYGLYTDAGLNTCSQGGRPYPIPGSYGYYQQDAATYASWGMDYVKMDWCNTIVNGTQLRPEVQYKEMSAALNATGHPMYFLTCEWGVDSPQNWMRKYANAWRATGDHHDNWESTAGIIEQAANLSSHGGPGGWNYLDFVMTGGEGCPSIAENSDPVPRCPGQTDTEYITEATIWVTAASPFIVATELRNMSDIQKQVLLNTELFAIHQDKLGQAGGRIGTWACDGPTNPPACQIWARPLFNGDMFVVLYNSDAVTHDITFPFDMIGWQVFPQVYGRDIWAHANIGPFNGSYTASVPSHGVSAIRFSLP